METAFSVHILYTAKVDYIERVRRSVILGQIKLTWGRAHVGQMKASGRYGQIVAMTRLRHRFSAKVSNVNKCKRDSNPIVVNNGKGIVSLSAYRFFASCGCPLPGNRHPSENEPTVAA